MKLLRFFFYIILALGAWKALAFWSEDEKVYDASLKTQLSLTVDGRVFPIQESRAETVGVLLEEQRIAFKAEDEIFPAPVTPLHSGMVIRLERSKHVTLAVGDEKHVADTRFTSVDNFLAEQGIVLGEHDFVLPDENKPLSDGDTLKIVRVEVSEEHLDKPIPFEKKTKEDPDISWRKILVEQKGENGIKRSTYRVTWHDGKEIARKLLKTETAKESVTEITTQGTLVKVGKKHTGLGTWYAHTGTLAAASPWLPMGSYARVTNPENGKTVIVKINDRGPFGKNRIIDLDKVAFQKIASIGEGVINVKVEEITN